MEVVPVIDLMGGVVVRGVAGRRQEYRPIVSRLCQDARPATVAAALAGALDCQRGYVADLDAIQKGTPDWRALNEISRHLPHLMVDIGVRGPDDARLLLDRIQPVADVIVGLESIDGPEQLSAIVDAVGPRVIFSLDMKQGRPITRFEGWLSVEPRRIVDDVVAMGIRRLILLDLAQVGTGRGVTTARVCRQVRDAYDDVEIVAGGGVRGLADVQLLADAGCDVVLVASALHDGRLLP